MDVTKWLRAQWDRVLGFALIGLGAVLMVAGYLGVSRSLDTPEALSYLVSGSLGGLFLLGVGASLLVLAALHDEWRKLNRVETALEKAAVRPGLAGSAVETTTSRGDVTTSWSARRQRVLGFALLGVGVVLLVVGYVGVSSSTDTPEALSYLASGGLAGLFLLGVGATLVISADLHDEGRKLDGVEAAIRATPAGPGGPGVRPEPGGSSREVRPDDLQVYTPARPGAPLAVAGPAGGLLVRRAQTFAGAGVALAVAVLALAWSRAAYAVSSRPALEGVAFALVALIVLAMAAGGSTSWARRNVSLRRTGLLAPWTTGSPRVATPVAAARRDDDCVLIAEDLTEYHRPGCPAVPESGAREVRPQDVPAGLRPCRLCEA
jgi:hypothetical protein